VTKDLPQWLLLKQKKEAEQMADWQKSVGALNEANFAIKDEITKHMQYMKELSEKVSYNIKSKIFN
jgi:cell division FtsZ-interacting protein ZapD